MERKCCNTCGGNLLKHDEFYICESCGNRFERKEDVLSQKGMHLVAKIETAWSCLRNGDFERATEIFSEIITEDSKMYEAYWGRAHARNGIVYVTDYNEKQKVPTCNNITENSFLEDKDVQFAISIAPDALKENYSNLAKRIEKIRTEWLEKARKEPPYDVFISYKDSDLPNGIERTQDSFDAQMLYTTLVEAGYKVFYSRNSLAGKVSEQYEPYIYNAIKTASVMIVFGEKVEYFNAVWVKNEWKRFLQRINNGEKQKNSLVVVYKDMNPSLLPEQLKNRQAMNLTDLSFSENLKAHIKRIIEAQNQSKHLDRVETSSMEIVEDELSEEDRLHTNKLLEQIANAKLRSTVTFGNFPQTDLQRKDPIEWIVLKKEFGQALLLSKYVLFPHEYSNFYDRFQQEIFDTLPHTPYCSDFSKWKVKFIFSHFKDCFWKNSTLHNYLNVDFYNEAFSISEGLSIVSASNYTNHFYRDYDSIKDTKEEASVDRVFVLSINDVITHFGLFNKRMLRAKPTPYAIKNRVFTEKGRAYWLLRNIAHEESHAKGIRAGWRFCCVNQRGKTVEFVVETPQNKASLFGVRPCIWVQYERQNSLEKQIKAAMIEKEERKANMLVSQYKQKAISGDKSAQIWLGNHYIRNDRTQALIWYYMADKLVPTLSDDKKAIEFKVKDDI